jgi:lipoyl synthase
MSLNQDIGELERKPSWLKVKLPVGSQFVKVKELVKNSQLHTVCESAHCPNIGECWNRKTATFMILGDVCTRNCRFCAVDHNKATPLDTQEPERVAEAVAKLGLNYAVITSVTRDDLVDGGANHFAKTISAIKAARPECKIEVLIPDFQGSEDALSIVLDAKPDVLNHNIETVPQLYSIARPQADYKRSLELLRSASRAGFKTKSGLMVGLGETMEQINIVMQDLVEYGCNMLTIGQYLQPSKSHLPVARYVEPKEFGKMKKIGLELGLDSIEAGPLVRSSYHADEQFDSAS